MKGFTVVFLAFCCYLAAVRAGDPIPKDGMHCQTVGGFEYCDGKTPNYTTFAAQAEAPDSKTRSSRAVQLTYGYNPNQMCDWNDKIRCAQTINMFTPTRLNNLNNQPRFILQNDKLRQKIGMAICVNSKCGSGTCNQQYTRVQLVACEPMMYSCMWRKETFRIPTCCRCSRAIF